MKFRMTPLTPIVLASLRLCFGPCANLDKKSISRRLVYRLLVVGWLLIGAVTVVAQTIPIEWVRQIGGPASEEVTKSGSLAIDAQGNCFITGNYHAEADFGTTNLSGFGGTDVFVAKYGAIGNLLWVRGAGGPETDGGTGLALDAEGNVFTTGYFSRTMTFESTVLISDRVIDMFIASYTTDGDLRWAKNYGVVGSELPDSIAVDHARALYVCGEFSGRTTSIGGIQLTNAYQDSGAGHDGFFAKFDQDGNVVWAQRAGGDSGDNGQDYTTALRPDDSGNVYLAGYFASFTVRFGPYTLINSGGGHMPYLAKFDASGGVLWARNLFTGGDSSIGLVAGLAVDGAGNSHVVGLFNNEVIIDGQRLTGNPGTTELFIAKFTTDGNLVWALAGGGTEADSPAAIALDDQGNSYITGAYWGPWKLGQLALPAIGPSYAADIVKIDGAGNVQWAYGAGSSVDAFGRAIAADASGNICVAGVFDGELSLGQTNLLSRGQYDIFLLKGPRPAPRIISQPQSTTVRVGDTVTFKVFATGEAPLAYKWLFNGAELIGFTESTLTLTNTTHAQAGFYSVVVSNQAGSVSSAVVQLLFDFLTLEMYAGLTIDGEAGQRYQIEYIPALGNPTGWRFLTNVTLTTVPYLFIDLESPRVLQRFYRALPLTE